MNCRCGHESILHEHLRRGYDCALCTCPAYRLPWWVWALVVAGLVAAAVGTIWAAAVAADAVLRPAALGMVRLLILAGR